MPGDTKPTGRVLNAVLVFLGGGAGAVARYFMGTAINRWMPNAAFPYHTFAINVAGAFAIGILLEVLALRNGTIQPIRLLLVTGFLGGFTTFSSFSLESALLLQRGEHLTLLAYVGLSVIVTIAAVFLGSAAVRPFL